ncbi:hypothetical protein SEA_NICEHOUSE_123 [Rhodococcus phage NiceHouse]|nr:hypothetical protein SEA_NICEHOUSE_123 [Rhodococcus phage NiceHouse]
MGLFNLLSTSEFIAGQKIYKEEIIMAVKDEINKLRESFEGLKSRIDTVYGPLLDSNAELKLALENERAAAEALRISEDAEDVDQNAALDAAKAATDEALRVNEEAAVEIGKLRGDVDATLPATEEPEVPAEPEPETPVDPAPPVETIPDEEPAAEPIATVIPADGFGPAPAEEK